MFYGASLIHSTRQPSLLDQNLVLGSGPRYNRIALEMSSDELSLQSLRLSFSNFPPSQSDSPLSAVARSFAQLVAVH